MNVLKDFLAEHRELSRRHFLQIGGAATAVWSAWPYTASGEPIAPGLAEAIANLESYFTPLENFQDVSRGKPLPHSLPDEKKREVGLTRETWQLEITSDPEHPAALRKPMTKEKGTALNFDALMKIAETHAVRFAKVMTCLNLGCPLGMGIWEGVPLRELIWMTKPGDSARRVFYYGYHNDDPEQMFRSSLPISRVLEDPFDLPPVIVCYKLNGQWLTSVRGGPVRIVVPEAYGFKNVKWLSHVVLTHLAHANDTYANENNDIDSPLKSFAGTISVPHPLQPGQPIPVTGFAQVGLGGLSKVQVWVHSEVDGPPADGPFFANAPWTDARILSEPTSWGGGLPKDAIPANTLGFDDKGHPQHWPLPLSKVHWAVLLPGLPAGKYTLRCRAVDGKGIGQPMPRPFRKSGHAMIEQVQLVVK